MNILAGLGHAAGGFGKGMLMGEQIQDMRDKRDQKKKQKDIEDQINQAAIDAINKYEQEQITVENPSGGIAPPTQQNSQLPIGLSNLDYTSPNEQTQIVQNFADGGMVQDQNSLVSQVNQGSGLSSMQPQQQQQPSNPQKRNPGFAMSKSFSAMRDKAMELGRPDLALQYQQAGFQVRDRLYKEGVTNAQRAFDMTGDIGGFVKVYNDIIDDDAKVDGYEKTDSGYKLKINSGGNIIEREFKPEQIRDMVMSFNDPAARYAAERAAMEARSKKTFETDEDIRKQTAVDGLKVQERDPYKSYVDGSGKVVQEAKDKPDGWKNNVQSVSGGYIQKNADGTETFVSTNGKGKDGGGTGKPAKDWNKEMLPVLKEVGDNIMGFEGMGTQDVNTGKVTPTKQGNEAMVFGQRLLKQNPDLLPADVAKLAHMAATDPAATDYQVLERSDGTRYKRQVIKSGGQIYQLSNASNSEVQKPKKELAETGSEEWRKDHKNRDQPAANFVKGGDTTGRYGKGNIDLNDRDIYVYPEKENRGSYSSLESITVNFDGVEYLLPKVVNGKMLSEDQAIDHFKKTKQYLGKFKTPEEASQYAIELERRQKSYYETGPGKKIKQRAFGESGQSDSKKQSPGLGSVIINKSEPGNYKFQDQIPNRNPMTEGDADTARQSMGLPRKQWYERKPAAVGLGSVVLGKSDRIGN